MKKADREEPPLVNIERNPLIILLSWILTIGMAYLTYQNLFAKEVMDVNPVAFLLLIPTLILFFQSLWYLLNPFALIYQDRFEIKWSFFGSKTMYYIDFNRITFNQKQDLILFFNDNEPTKLNLTGIKSSHRSQLHKELQERIKSSLEKRD